MTILAVAPIKSVMTWDNWGKRAYTSYYHVSSDTHLEAPITVLTAAGIPKYMEQYAWGTPTVTDPWAFAVRAKCDWRDSSDRTQWLVTIWHRTIDIHDQQFGVDPWDDPKDQEPRWTTGTDIVQGEYTKDQANTQDPEHMKDAAGVPTDPVLAPKRIQWVQVELITDTSVSLSTQKRTVDHLNDDVFWTLPAKTVKCVYWETSDMAGGVGPSRFLRTQHVIRWEVDPDDLHKLKRPAVGRFAVEDGAATTPEEKWKAAEDATGRSIVVPLKADGTPDLDGTAPHEVEVEGWPTADFTVFPAKAQTLPSHILP